MKIEFLEAAQTELDEAFNWYETRKKDLGVQFLTEFDAALEEFPLIQKRMLCL